ncbi:SUMF1/EgtB/PvdO family nonheme iron enzyme [Enterobacter asburiae]|nr:hypothetical protein N037_15040 [Enterobacter sp. EGD-HP1]
MNVMNKYKVLTLVSLSAITLAGCDNAKSDAENHKFANNIVNSMVVVKGGRFQMGDFGPLVGEKLPFSPDQNNKPLHWVELSDFHMSAKRITWREFNEWLELAGRGKSKYYLWATEKDRSERFKKTTGDDFPAVANWKDASDFCQWIGTISNKKITLPTEAQWEYAARSGGKFNQFANGDNYYNVSWPDEKQNFTFDFAPVGSFAPNSLGLFDMMGNGHDWVNDWYAEDYYQHSPERDPQGPANGTEKVVRGYLGSMFGLYDITRGSNKPETEGPGYGFRCVEN